MVGIMLVEDHVLFRQALAVLLNGEPDLCVVAQAGSLAEARAHVVALRNLVQLAIVDFALPDGGAMEFIKELCRSLPDVKVMVFTASVDPGTTSRALESGARATLHKTASKGEILAAVRGLLEA